MITFLFSQIFRRLETTLLTFVPTGMLLCLLSLASLAHGSLQVAVVDTRGQPLAGTVVFLNALGPTATSGNMPESATMDQVKRQFSPHILVVSKGTSVAFPNSDSIKHHVYSFSDAKTFELKLYKDRSGSPILFDVPGEVELACNIHDWMLGYIFVVEGEHYARTDDAGEVAFQPPDGRYRLGIWHPRLQEVDKDFFREIKLVSDVPQEIVIQLSRSLLPAYDPTAAAPVEDYE